MDAVDSRPKVALVTIIGLALLLSPVLTMAHEVGGHAMACLATGGQLREVGAFYVDCQSATPLAARLVAMSGSGADLLVFVACFLVWRVARGDLLRLGLWYAFVVKGMTATGYWLFSGLTGIGDWGPGPEGGIGPLSNELAIRGALTLVGFVAYLAVVRIGLRTFHEMMGGGPLVWATKRKTALGFYIVNGVLSLAIGLLNPVGLFITLASAAASSFGGCAGLFSIAFNRSAPPARQFDVGPKFWILALGLVVAVAFTVVLGPTLKF